MEAQFIDRILTCSDCHGEFIFTAGEQVFFFDKQFKNDPKRCKPCKSRRSGLTAAATGAGMPPAGLSRTETRTECSDCGIETTVPFKPTQGRPVLCRQCFQTKGRAGKPAAAPHGANVSPKAAGEMLSDTQVALKDASANGEGMILSQEAAVLAAASMQGASARSSVASHADLASITAAVESSGAPVPPAVPRALLAAAKEHGGGELYLGSPDAGDA